MSARLRMLALVVGMLPTFAAGSEPTASTGAVLYRQYCASCHGTTGHGDGPASGALTPPPTNLTRLTTPVPELMQQIDGRQPIRAHGTAAMPVWGHVFEQARAGERHKGRAALLQVELLAEYVRSLQRD